MWLQVCDGGFYSGEVNPIFCVSIGVLGWVGWVDGGDVVVESGNKVVVIFRTKVRLLQVGLPSGFVVRPDGWCFGFVSIRASLLVSEIDRHRSRKAFQLAFLAFLTAF